MALAEYSKSLDFVPGASRTLARARGSAVDADVQETCTEGEVAKP